MAELFTSSLANLFPSQFKDVYVKNSTATADTKYASLGIVKDFDVKIGGISISDGLMREHATGIHAEIKFKMMQTSLVEIELLDGLCDGKSSWAFVPIDADSTWTSDARIILLTEAMVGAYFNLSIEGDISGERYIEVVVSGTIKLDSVNAVFNSALAGADLFVGTGNKFSPIATTGSSYNVGFRGRIFPSGIKQVVLTTADGTATITNLKNTKLTLQGVHEPDQFQRPRCFAWDFALEYEHLETMVANATIDATNNLMNLDAMKEMLNVAYTSIVATMIGGKTGTSTTDNLTFTLTGAQCGINTTFESAGNYDKHRILRVKHSGRILRGATAIAGLFS